MAEKSDDIKNLFLNLGLNPGDYHEIRSAPTANATVSEAPRRWSLLQAAAIKPVAAMPAPVAAAFELPPALAAAPPVAPPSASSPQDAIFSSMSALLAAAQDITRAEASLSPEVERPTEILTASRIQPQPPPVPASLPPALQETFAVSNSHDGLQSLFQSVKEPQTVSVIPAQPPQGGRRTDQLRERAPVSASLSQRAASMMDNVSGPLSSSPPPRLVDFSDEPETRYAPQPSRLGPVPAPSAPAPVATPVLAALDGRLRFTPAAAQSVAGHGESLQDVFRRLSRDNRG